MPFGVDLAATPAGHLADLGDQPVVDGDIGCTWRAAAPVNDSPVADHDISHVCERTE